MDVHICVNPGDEQHAGRKTQNEAEHTPRDELFDRRDRKALRHSKQAQIEDADRADKKRHADEMQTLTNAPHPQIPVNEVFDTRPSHPVAEKLFHLYLRTSWLNVGACERTSTAERIARHALTLTYPTASNATVISA